jgi:hypothetical protein
MWIWISDTGREARYFAMTNTPALTIWSIQPEAAARLLGK